MFASWPREHYKTAGTYILKYGRVVQEPALRKRKLQKANMLEAIQTG